MFSYLRDTFANTFKQSGDAELQSGSSNISSDKGKDVSNSSGLTVTQTSRGNFRKMTVRRPERGKGKEMDDLTTKYPYNRPIFLELAKEQLDVCLNHYSRVINVPKRSNLPRCAGYAECTNAGKSSHNEDQAAVNEFKLDLQLRDTEVASDFQALELMEMYLVLDGHAGSDVAVTVSHELPHRTKERLADVIDDMKVALASKIVEEPAAQTLNNLLPPVLKKQPTVDRLVTGALEAAFHDMDENLKNDELLFNVKGGCAAVMALFYANKLYIANAGDSRAVMVRQGDIIPMSTDFTPETERRRIQQIAEHHPDLLGDEFCSKQFVQRVTRKDINTQMLYRDSRMEGWANTIICEEDLRFPLIIGEGKRARLLATIGLTRGLGDHNLKVFDSNIMIKPFLSSTPEVKVYDLGAGEVSPDDVVILGTDGLWDVVSNEEAVGIVKSVFSNLPHSDTSRYIAAAQALVSQARGERKADRRDVWVLSGSNDYSSHDDVTCFVIPLLHYPCAVTNDSDMTGDDESVPTNDFFYSTTSDVSDQPQITVSDITEPQTMPEDVSSSSKEALSGLTSGTPKPEKDQILSELSPGSDRKNSNDPKNETMNAQTNNTQKATNTSQSQIEGITPNDSEVDSSLKHGEVVTHSFT